MIQYQTMETKVNEEIDMELLIDISDPIIIKHTCTKGCSSAGKFLISNLTDNFFNLDFRMHMKSFIITFTD